MFRNLCKRNRQKIWFALVLVCIFALVVACSEGIGSTVLNPDNATNRQPSSSSTSTSSTNPTPAPTPDPSPTPVPNPTPTPTPDPTPNPTTKQWTVTLDLNGGTGVTELSKLVNDGALYNLTTLPTYTGHTLVGFKDSNGIDFLLNVSRVTHDVTLVAQWKLTTWPLTIDLNGGSGVSPLSYTVNDGATFNLVGMPYWEGHTFTGFKDDSGATFGINQSRITRPTTIIAQWKAFWELTVDLNGGTTLAPPNYWVNDGETFNLQTLPTYAGHKLMGFKDSSGADFKMNSTVVTRPINIIAQWKLAWTVTVNLDGGSTSAATTYNLVEDGTAVPVLNPAPRKDTKALLGYKDDLGATFVFGQSLITRATTVTAQWSANLQDVAAAMLGYWRSNDNGKIEIQVFTKDSTFTQTSPPNSAINLNYYSCTVTQTFFDTGADYSRLAPGTAVQAPNFSNMATCSDVSTRTLNTSASIASMSAYEPTTAQTLTYQISDLIDSPDLPQTKLNYSTTIYGRTFSYNTVKVKDIN